MGVFFLFWETIMSISSVINRGTAFKRSGARESGIPSLLVPFFLRNKNTGHEKPSKLEDLKDNLDLPKL